MRRLQESGVDVAQLASDFHKAGLENGQNCQGSTLFEVWCLGDISGE